MISRIGSTWLLMALLVCFVFPSGLWAGAEAPSGKDRSPGAAVSAALASVTGMAISPLLGTGIYGAYLWFDADTPAERAALPWFAQMTFWLPALLIVGVCAAKDSLAAALPPGFKKPLDVLEAVENKVSGLVAAGAVLPFTMDSLSKVLIAQGPAAPALPTGFATLPIGAIDFSWLLTALTLPLALAVFAVVWMASHAINVLILLSPWGAVDTALKAARTGLLGLVALSAGLNPWLGALLSLAVIFVSWLVAGWSFRLTIFGTVFSWEFLTFRRLRFRPQSGTGNGVFSGPQLCAQGLPVRTYGRWLNEPENGGWRFAFRPWLVLPERSIRVSPQQPAIGRGLFLSTVRDGDETTFTLPPRYRGHEDALVALYQIEGGVQSAGLRRAWSLIRELFAGAPGRGHRQAA
jgi:MFS family permease